MKKTLSKESKKDLLPSDPQIRWDPATTPLGSAFVASAEQWKPHPRDTKWQSRDATRTFAVQMGGSVADQSQEKTVVQWWAITGIEKEMAQSLHMG